MVAWGSDQYKEEPGDGYEVGAAGSRGSKEGTRDLVWERDAGSVGCGVFSAT